MTYRTIWLVSGMVLVYLKKCFTKARLDPCLSNYASWVVDSLFYVVQYFSIISFNLTSFHGWLLFVISDSGFLFFQRYVNIEAARICSWNSCPLI